jgi:hypothetical protein
MTTLIRKQIYIESEQDALFKRLSGETGTSEAELIRQAINRQLRATIQPHRDLNVWQRERVFLHQLIDQPAAPSSRQWTRDDLYDR